VGKLLHHSCRSELTRQGISLPLDRQSYGRRLLDILIKATTLIIFMFSTGQVSVPILIFTNLQRPVFLLNSYSPQFNVNSKRFPLVSHPFSQSYRINLPSSFNKIISSALVYSTCLPVSVYSTVLNFLKLFLEEYKKQDFTYLTISYSCHLKKIPII